MEVYAKLGQSELRGRNWQRLTGARYLSHATMPLNMGGVAERLNAPVLKTGIRVSRIAGSNPAPTAFSLHFKGFPPLRHGRCVARGSVDRGRI